LLILWQFNQWGLFSKYRHLFQIVLLTFVFVWVIDNFIIGSPFVFNSYARIINSFLIVLMSIQLLSGELLASWESFWKNSVLLVLFSYVIFFCSKDSSRGRLAVWHNDEWLFYAYYLFFLCFR
jgi:hypothetical protein